MLKIERSECELTLKRLDEKQLTDLGWTERGHLQQMIRRSPEVFFSELEENLMLVGEEVMPAELVDDRIDLLAIDTTGATVVIELKRKSHKLQLLQALSYAAMISKWDSEEIAKLRSDLVHADGTHGDELEGFLAEDITNVNRRQRVILVAEEFEWEVLATAEWLSEQHGVDIRCYRMSIAVDGSGEYLSCTCVYPPKELADHARRRSRRVAGESEEKWPNWDAALAVIENSSLVSFFREELANKQESYLPKRTLWYRLGGKRRFCVSAHRKQAYVWQVGRFSDDEAFWYARVKPDTVKAVKEGRSLRFFLESNEDIRAFRTATSSDLTHVSFQAGEFEPLDLDEVTS